MGLMVVTFYGRINGEELYDDNGDIRGKKCGDVIMMTILIVLLMVMTHYGDDDVTGVMVNYMITL